MKIPWSDKISKWLAYLKPVKDRFLNQVPQKMRFPKGVQAIQHKFNIQRYIHQNSCTVFIFLNSAKESAPAKIFC